MIRNKEKVLIIAEIGVNHNGSLIKAKSLIKKAKICGADLVKFQLYKTDKLIDQDHVLAEYQKKSEKIKREGFFTYTTEDRVKSQAKFLNKISKSDINIASGEEGSILVFQNNIIHRGSLPLKDKRNLIALEVLPSTTKMNNNDLTKVLSKPFTIDFPKNPFLNN